MCPRERARLSARVCAARETPESAACIYREVLVVTFYLPARHGVRRGRAAWIALGGRMQPSIINTGPPLSLLYNLDTYYRCTTK